MPSPPSTRCIESWRLISASSRESACCHKRMDKWCHSQMLGNSGGVFVCPSVHRESAASLQLRTDAILQPGLK